MVFAPGFMDKPAKMDLAADMLRFTFPYILFISLVSVAAGVLNTYGRFAVPAFTPVFLNLSLIAAAIWLSPYLEQPVMALAWGVFIGGVIQLLFQLPFLYRLRMLSWPRWGVKTEGVRRILRLMGPAIFGVSVAQINLLLDTLIASFLVTGSVSWLYYSDRLVEFPLGVFGIALATVILPSLSKKHAEASREDFSHTLDWALRWVLVIGMPATLGLIMLAGPMLATLFHYDAFDMHALRMATLSLMAYSLGLLGFILIKVLAPGFYARQDTRTPVRIGIIAMAANMVLNIAFVVPMVMLGFEGPHAGLALATSLGAFINAGLLFLTLRKQGVYQARPGWAKLIVQVILAACAMAGLLWWAVPEISQWSEWGVWDRVLWLGVLIAVAIAVYFLALILTGVKLRSLLQRASQ
jgi:putative peptidoglycan lipid II flippase